MKLTPTLDGFSTMSQQEYTPNWTYPQDFSSDVSIDFQISSKGSCSSMFFSQRKGVVSYLTNIIMYWPDILEQKSTWEVSEKNKRFEHMLQPFVGPKITTLPRFPCGKEHHLFCSHPPIGSPDIWTECLKVWDLSACFVGIFFGVTKFSNLFGEGNVPF